jgi:hypothetical protein
MFVSPFRCGRPVRECLPKIYRRIGSPRLDTFQVETRVKFERALENQVGPGKRIGITEGSKANIFGGPGAEPLGFKERFAKCSGILRPREQDGAAQHAMAEIPNRRFSRRAGRELAEIVLRQRFRRWK